MQGVGRKRRNVPGLEVVGCVFMGCCFSPGAERAPFCFSFLGVRVEIKFSLNRPGGALLFSLSIDQRLRCYCPAPIDRSHHPSGKPRRPRWSAYRVSTRAQATKLRRRRYLCPSQQKDFTARGKEVLALRASPGNAGGELHADRHVLAVILRRRSDVEGSRGSYLRGFTTGSFDFARVTNVVGAPAYSS